MAVQVRYIPPKINAAVRLAVAKDAIEREGARELLVRTLPHVPFDTGTLYASGDYRETINGHAAVTFSAVNEEDHYDYAAHVHEDMTADHPHGESKFLERTMHRDGGAVLHVMAHLLARVFHL
jgi:hypothetical protein